MCNVSGLPVKETVNSFVTKGEPFTGQDVYVALTDVLVNRQAVSSCVRELFNTGDPVFDGWGCMKVGGNAGPLLYFKVLPSTKAAKKAAEILAALHG